MTDSDDECLMELDVYVDNDSKKNEDLFLFQYLLRHKDRPYGDGGNQMTKVERSVPNSTPPHQEIGNYDPSSDLKELGDISQSNLKESKRLKEISNFRLTYEMNQGNEKDKTKKPNYDSNAVDHRMTKFQLKSEKVIQNESLKPNYFIGNVKDDRVVLTPINNFH